MSTLIITADLGHFRAYRITKDPLGRPIIDLIESYDSLEGHGKLVDKLSDAPGRFRGGGGKDESARAYGEPHNMETETRKKLAKMIAMDINSVVRREKPENWYLAATEKINAEIIRNLEPNIRSGMGKNISVDLTKTAKSEILDHFA